MKRFKKTAWNELEAKGDHRVNKIQLRLRQQYQGIPNRLVIPHFGKGTGVDIIVVAEGNKILELHEVTNYQKFQKNGRPIYLDPKKVPMYIGNLTQKVYWISFGRSKKRLYPTPETKRFFDISYESNLLAGQRQQFQANGIKIIVHNKTDFPAGYTVEDNKGNKKSFYENGQEIII